MNYFYNVYVGCLSAFVIVQFNGRHKCCLPEMCPGCICIEREQYRLNTIPSEDLLAILCFVFFMI